MDRERYNRQRERTDKISSLMGQYLLKGYRMLGTCCEKCDTVLLKFRDEPDYCVGCEEVDVDTKAGLKNAAVVSPDHPEHNWQVATTGDGYSIPQQEAKQVQETSILPSLDSVNIAINNLNEKIISTSEALRSCNSVEESIRYCELLKSCAETLKALRNVEQI